MIYNSCYDSRHYYDFHSQVIIKKPVLERASKSREDLLAHRFNTSINVVVLFFESMSRNQFLRQV